MIIESVLYEITSQEPLVCSSEVRLCNPCVIIAAPDNFYPQPLVPEIYNTPESTMPIVEILYPDIPQDTPKKPTTLTNIPARLIQEADQIAAQRAWKYFGRNWNPQTGLVNSVDHLPWTTWWD